MVKSSQGRRNVKYVLEFSDEPVTSFGGIVLAERVASRLGLWSSLESRMPKRTRCQYDWLTIIKTMVSGLLSGSRGTYCAEEIREDSTVQKLMCVNGAPEEATVWRMLEELGQLHNDGTLPKIQTTWARKVLNNAPRKDLLRDGFFPVFGDGTLLEGSDRREGTKYYKKKGSGLLWSTVFTGPVMSAQRLAKQGEGETTCFRSMLSDVVERVLKPLKLKKKALMLMDSAYGGGPTLEALEGLKLHYIVGANGLSQSRKVLQEQPSSVWYKSATRSESEMCVCWIQCEEWKNKRLLVGRRWKEENEMVWNYASVITDLSEKNVKHLKGSFPDKIWKLYSAKAGMEDYYKDALEDLGGHHPPCQELIRNQGFYAVLALAHTLGTAVELIGGQGEQRGLALRKDGKKRKRPKPMRMRLWRVRRRLFTLPARVIFHARVVNVTLLGVSQTLREQFERYFYNVCRC